jgi:hypothetical protein
MTRRLENIMRRKDPVAELLQTSNKKEQVASIQQLLQLVNAPVMTIAITFDSRTSKVNAEIVGAEAPNEIVQQVLDGAKNLFNQQEIARQIELQTEETDEELPEPIPGDIPEGDEDAEQDSSPDRREPLEMADATPSAD